MAIHLGGAGFLNMFDVLFQLIDDRVFAVLCFAILS